MTNLQKIIRPNILRLKAYSSARDEFSGSAGIYMDANENPYNTGYNRYPDPHQRAIKARLAVLKGTGEKNIFLGNGSDEPIDLLFRLTCEPGTHNALVLDPSYGMYEVSAMINDIELRKIPLTPEFQLDRAGIMKRIDENSRLLFLCSPNNPTGNLLDKNDLRRLFHTFPGLIILDEAYIDFADDPGFIAELPAFPNLVVLQTFSKAWGMAGLRVGCAYGSEEVIGYLEKIKPPYNINQLSQQLVLEALDSPEKVSAHAQVIIRERKKLGERLGDFSFIKRIFPSDSNFLLIQVEDPQGLYYFLVDLGIIVRDRSTLTHCGGCLRITVGLPQENEALITALEQFDQ